MAEVVIRPDDPTSPDVVAVLEAHLTFADEHSPPEDVHALDVSGLLDATVSFFSARRAGTLVAIGAIRELDPRHGELKSMHTVGTQRRQGLGRLMVTYLLGVARSRGYRRVSLETGSMEAFAPARSLYLGAGFSECGPFGDYRPSANSTFMTLALV